MSHSGVQVEYVSAGRVLGVEPSVGVVSGGTIVTLSGEGFVAGRTACRFGSAESTKDGVWQESGLQYRHVGAVSVQRVSPTMANVEGGSIVSLVASGVEDGASVTCVFGGSVMVAA